MSLGLLDLLSTLKGTAETFFALSNIRSCSRSLLSKRSSACTHLKDQDTVSSANIFQCKSQTSLLLASRRGKEKESGAGSRSCAMLMHWRPILTCSAFESCHEVLGLLDQL
jgi:hypothetical protein